MFRYDAAIIERFPTVQAGVIHATGLSNGPSPADLLEEYVAAQAMAVERLAATPIAEIPSIVAWRRTFTAFGVKPTRYRSAAEAVQRRLDKHGDIPSINTLVDIGNLVSTRYAVPVAVFDLAATRAPITVGFAEGDEPFTDLGSAETVHPEPGEVVFTDAAGVVCARRWCWRQSAQSATGPTTTEVVIVTEALHETAAVDVDSALSDLATLLATHQPAADIESKRLSAGDSAF